MAVSEKEQATQAGRPPVVLTDDEIDAYLAAIENGASNRGAAEKAGIGYWITRRMYAMDPKFAKEVDDAREVAAQDAQRLSQEQADRLAKREETFGEALEGLLTFAEVGRRIGRSKEYVRQMVNRGRLPIIRTPFGRLVVEDEVDVERFPNIDR